MLNRGGFELQADPGKWLTSDRIQVDLVPESLAGPDRRGVLLPGHGRRVARRAEEPYEVEDLDDVGAPFSGGGEATPEWSPKVPRAGSAQRAS